MLVRWEHGGSTWYKIKKGRSLDRLMAHFRSYSHFKWAHVHYYKNGRVGEKWFWFTENQHSYNF